MAHFLKVLYSLTRKNIHSHVVRHPVGFLFSFYVIPCVLMALLLLIPTLATSSETYGAASPAPLKSLSDLVDQKLVIVQTPNLGADVNRVVKTFTKDINQKLIEIVDNEDKIISLCSKHNLVGNCFAAVTFTDSPESKTAGNHTWTYNIRTEKHTTTNKEYLSHKSQEEMVYMPLQVAINNAIGNYSTMPEAFMFSITQDVDDNLKRDTATSMVGVVYTFAVFGCFFVMIYRLTAWITMDRDSGMSRLIDSMGSSWCLPARTLSWIIFMDLMCLPLFVIFGILYWKLVFDLSDAFPIIGWQILLGLSVNSATVFAASFFSKARVSAIYVIAMFLILSLTMQLFMARPDSERIPAMVWTLPSIFPSSSHALFTKQMLFWQNAGLKADYSKFPPGSPTSVADLTVVTQNQTLAFLAAQIVVYTALAVISEWGFHGISSKRRSLSDAKELASTASVAVKDLQKVFKPGFWTRLCCCGRRGKVSAVRNVTFEAYSDQIMCLAGPNGSGKTTTLHALAGFIRPTSGWVALRDSRAQVGICPQQNTLWDDMTVLEHVQLWSQIKNGSDTAEEIDCLIMACHLSEKKHSYAKTLSGGQKRKLQLACMFVGGSTLCLIDECTSGLDPLSRRAIWDVLLEYRIGRSIIFTTHFLDEVDVLADHIVVLSAGTVRCQGSPAELNNTHGSGYQVSMPRERANTMPNVQYKSVFHQGKLVFTTPDSASAIKLAKDLVAGGTTGVAIAGPQFEDVFLNVSADTDSTLSSTSGSEAFDLTPGRSISFLRQLGILFWKRFQVLPKLWVSYFFAAVLPIAISCLLLLVLNDYEPIKCADRKLSLGSTDAEPFFYTPTCSMTGYCGKVVLGPEAAKPKLRDITKQEFKDLQQVNMSYFDEFVISENDRQSWLDYIMDNRKEGHYQGIYAGSDNEKPVIAYQPMRSFSTISGGFDILNLWSEMSNGVQINAEYGLLGELPSQDDGLAAVYSILFILVQSIYPAMFVLYPAIERASKTRALQLANGVRPGPVILSHALFDSMFVILNSVIVPSVIAAALPYWVGSAGTLFLVLLLYGVAAGLMGQIVSHFASGPLRTFLLAFAVNLAMFMIAAGAYTAETLASAAAAKNIAFGLGLFLPIGNVYRSLIIGLSFAGEGCASDHVKLSSSMESYSGPIVFLLLQVMALATAAVWLEGGIPAFKRKTAYARMEDIEMVRRSTPGDDVATEVSRVESSPSDMLRALHVTKSFQSNVALDDVTFGLGNSEVLALIGPNGAGKSTFINILQGELAADAGSVTLCGEDSRRASARRFLGVCPQFDALDLLSTRQHLTFYARIRGVKNVKQDVDYLLKRLDLTPHAKKQASKLSGGNKRKLSLAIAMMGKPSVMALDEPTTAMDAMAKRAFWELIKAATIGSSILLTTHSMEEADTLANRAAILAGKMLAIGTTQDLRSKYGRQCHVNVHLKSAPGSSTEEMRRVWSVLSEWIPRASLERDMSRGQIRFTVPEDSQGDSEAASLQFIRIGEIMEACKERLGVEYYSVSGATLEGAFINVIQDNEYRGAEDMPDKKTSLWKRLLGRP